MPTCHTSPWNLVRVLPTAPNTTYRCKPCLPVTEAPGIWWESCPLNLTWHIGVSHTFLPHKPLEEESTPNRKDKILQEDLAHLNLTPRMTCLRTLPVSLRPHLYLLISSSHSSNLLPQLRPLFQKSSVGPLYAGCVLASLRWVWGYGNGVWELKCIEFPSVVFLRSFCSGEVRQPWHKVSSNPTTLPQLSPHSVDHHHNFTVPDYPV